MGKIPRPEYQFTELDPVLPCTPYKTHTNWHVIAGAPCSGKTTLINRLAQRGFHTVPEAARLYLEKAMAGEHPEHPIRQDPVALQQTIEALQLSLEAELPSDAFLVLDGALPGCMSYARAYGVDPNAFLPDCFHHRYAAVFLLAPLPFCPDHERAEELVAVAGYLDEWQQRDYQALGYDVIRVPVLPVEERLAFILARLPLPPA